MATIQTPNAPAAIGPYSQGQKHCQLIFTSGQIPFTPEGVLVEGGVTEQSEQAMKNLAAVIEAGGGDLSTVIKCTVFIKDMNDFGAINEVYAKHFGDHKPARSCVEVARLPKDVLVEIEAIAVQK